MSPLGNILTKLSNGLPNSLKFTVSPHHNVNICKINNLQHIPPSCGVCRGRTITSNNFCQAKTLDFGSSYMILDNYNRCYGQSVRPVHASQK